jgi:hypothetical protein
MSFQRVREGDVSIFAFAGRRRPLAGHDAVCRKHFFLLHTDTDAPPAGAAAVADMHTNSSSAPCRRIRIRNAAFVAHRVDPDDNGISVARLSFQKASEPARKRLQRRSRTWPKPGSRAKPCSRSLPTVAHRRHLEEAKRCLLTDEMWNARRRLSRASARSARVGTSAHFLAPSQARSRGPTCRTAGSAAAVPASSSLPPRDRNDRSPLRHNVSKSADAGIRSRSVGRACSDRL